MNVQTNMQKYSRICGKTDACMPPIGFLPAKIVTRIEDSRDFRKLFMKDGSGYVCDYMMQELKKESSVSFIYRQQAAGSKQNALINMLCPKPSVKVAHHQLV